MLKPEMFTYGENDVQFYYFFKNEAPKELVQIIRNKKEKNWFGMYDSDKNGFFTIPIYTDENPKVMLQRVSDWYNNGKARPQYREIEETEPKTISKTLYGLENMFGQFPLSSAKRIQAYLDDPSVERWDDISGIIVDGHDSVWQAILDIDRTFPRTGPTTDITGKIVSDWLRIPEPFLILKAVKEKLKRQS